MLIEIKINIHNNIIKIIYVKRKLCIMLPNNLMMTYGRNYVVTIVDVIFFEHCRHIFIFLYIIFYDVYFFLEIKDSNI